MKICSQCRIEKPLSEFRKQSKNADGLQSACKACQRLKRTQWLMKNPGKAAAQSRLQRAKNPEKANAAQKRWRDANPDKIKANMLRKRYNMTPDQWQRIFDAQGGRCAICDIHQSETQIELAVDHCHLTGKIRGLLCVPCNRAMGLFKDSPVHLRRAADYLEVINPHAPETQSA